MKRYQFYNDLTPTTHTLVCGASGSGKSVIINGILSHLLYDSCMLVCIDLKKVELSTYKNSIRCVRYADNITDAKITLKWVLAVIDDRYIKLEKAGLKKKTDSPIYIIIDELADLVTVDKSIIPLLQRIGQIGRAANVKLLCGTQILLAEVLPTKLTCNFDTVIGLRTENARQSTRIIGCKGLENLPLYGYCCIRKYGKLDWCKGISMIPDNEITEEIERVNNALHPPKKKNTSIMNKIKGLFK